ncbi:MAG: ATP-binding cassette domain-containing protein, partial [Pseudomonadota bacterium]|nr:ATP-binding cassette domain-containing protein [Pseudomonadota bacterium]
MMHNKILAVNDLVAGYGETEILHDINIEVAGHEIVSIIGPNGAGKSTVMKAILGILNIKGGSIFLESKEITRVKPSDVVKLGVGYVPQ